jgi:hypothetical protein
MTKNLSQEGLFCPVAFSCNFLYGILFWWGLILQERGRHIMKWLTKVMTIVVGVGVLYPTLSMAQPAGRTTSGEYARGLAAPLLSVVYFPVKLGVGVAGAVLGGASGFLTGGNERAAEGIWRPMTGGTYFITPEVLEGEQRFLPLDYGPSAPPQTPSQYMQP